LWLARAAVAVQYFQTKMARLDQNDAGGDEHQIRKTYYCISLGRPAWAEGEVVTADVLLGVRLLSMEGGGKFRYW
jgi:hypothetical protein